MKCEYTFSVKSKVSLTHEFRLEHKGLEFELLTEDKRFTKLKVTARGIQFSDFPRVENRPTEPIPRIVIPRDPIRDHICRQVRLARGLLSLWGIIDIDVAHPVPRWDPETPEEDAKTHVFGVDLRAVPPEESDAYPGEINLIFRSIVAREKFEEYEIPLEFLRRGSRDLHFDQFIEAIYDFFFVLEFLFGAGKFRERDLVRNFSEKPELCEAFQHARHNPLPTIQSSKELLLKHTETL